MIVVIIVIAKIITIIQYIKYKISKVYLLLIKLVIPNQLQTILNLDTCSRRGDSIQ
jgi:hypothetical protein